MTTNPSIFAAASPTGAVRRPGARARRRGRRRRQGHLRPHHHRRARRLRRDARDASTPPTASTAGSPSRSPPDLAHDTDATVASAKELWAEVDRPNLLIKIPATTEGGPAITADHRRGHQRQRDADLRPGALPGASWRPTSTGLEQAARQRPGPLADPLGGVLLRLPRRHRDRQAARANSAATDDLRGKAGVANARLAYQTYEEFFSGDRWAALEAAGANKQRPLWASTGVKNPDYRDTMYVDDLVVANTVNTMPEKTLDAVARPRRDRRRPGPTHYDDAAAGDGGAQGRRRRLRRRHRGARAEGVDKFVASLGRAPRDRAGPARAASAQ